MADPNRPDSTGSVFTSYQKLVIAMLTFLQFTIVLDFMILSPLGAVLMPSLHISPTQFGLVVSAYAFSAAISGILAAGIADRYDRKSLLLTFYTGFLVGTLLCGVATNYPFLLFARIITGLFGGVIGSISFAIVADLFPLQSRGRVMGFIQSAFSASQVMGIPIGLFLANRFGWHGPFRLIVGLGAIAGVLMFTRLRPIDAHLTSGARRDPVQHLWATATNPRYLVGFLAVMLVAAGGFVLQPFSSAFIVQNVGIPLEHLPILYMVAGGVGMVLGPTLGRVSDSIGKFRLLAIATISGMVIVFWFTHLDKSPLWLAIVANCCLVAMITGRQVATMALISAVPAPADRGAYMSVSSSMQQLAGAVAASVAGALVIQSPSGRIENYPTLGAIVIAAMAITLAQMWNVNRLVTRPAAPQRPVSEPAPLSAGTQS